MQKALTEANGDINAAAEAMRKSGAAKADKKADRVAAEGPGPGPGWRQGRAGRSQLGNRLRRQRRQLQDLRQRRRRAALASGANDVEAVKAATLADGRTVEEARATAVQTLGENIQIRRMVKVDTTGNIGAYVHTNGKVGVLVDLIGGDVELARGLAMHVAALKPPHNKAADVPADFVERKGNRAGQDVREGQGQAGRDPGKIISGKINKIVSDVTLYGQTYVLGDTTVEQVVKAAGADVAGFKLLIVGEGIEKVVEDAAEVKAMQV